MRHVMVRYRVNPAHLERHESLLRGVFEALAEARPPGLRYTVLRAPDPLDFVHYAVLEGSDNPLVALPAFRAFSADIAARCDDPPKTTELSSFADYR